jgi:hypothetical protein
VGLHGLASGVLQQGYAVGYLVGRPALFAFLGISGMGGDFGALGMNGCSLASPPSYALNWGWVYSRWTSYLYCRIRRAFVYAPFHLPLFALCQAVVASK